MRKEGFEQQCSGRIFQMAQPSKGRVDYSAILRKAPIGVSKLTAFLLMELPYIWREAYVDMTSRQTNIMRWQYESFEYLFDDYASLERTGAVAVSEILKRGW
jgi:hypothetical protein